MISWQRRWLSLVGWAALIGMAYVPRAYASQYFDNQRGEIAARVSSQNTFQHNGADSINWVQWRNELRFDLKYDLIQQGVGQSFGPINAFKFNILWRGRYDAAYELRDSYKRRDYDRGNFEFPEGKTPRELFFDIGFSGALSDLSLRIGKQQVVWGESDLFRSLDIVNPLDLRQNGFVGEDFADFRQPLWIAKGLYHFGDVASFWNEAGLEVFFSPNGRPEVNPNNILVGETYKIHPTQSVVSIPNTRNFGFNRNMSIRFRQVRHPWEFLRVGAQPQDSPAVVENPDGSYSDFIYRIKNDVPPTELSTRAMMAGVRLLGTTFGNAYFTLNYLFKRTDGNTSEVDLTQLFNPTAPPLFGPGPQGGQQADVLARTLNATLTPDTDGNGIPDGQDQQILNCLQNKYPTRTGFDGGPNPFGDAPLTTGHAGEIILDPRAVNPAFAGAWHGSVYSDPAHPELATGLRKPGVNQLTEDHVSYKVPGLGAGDADGLVHSSACLDIPVQHNWTHIIGGTMTYNDYEHTGLVFRLEQSFSTKEGRQNSPNAAHRLLLLRDKGAQRGPTARDFETRANRYIQVWRSMVGFDYLRALAPQFGHKVQNPVLHSLLTDQWFFTFQFLNTYDSHADHVNSPASFQNRFEHFNPFFTVSGSGFFMHQTFAPIWAVAFDPTVMTPLFFIQGKYFFTPKLEMRIGEVLYAGSYKNEDPNGLNYYADRDTFYIRFTYYLA